MQDKRSNKIVVAAHCILNQNSRVQGLARFPATVKPVIETLLEQGTGIIQMPCPELLYAGYKRWAQTKDQYDTPNYRRFCRKIAKQIVDQIIEYLENGVEVKALIGVKGSPTCAITQTTRGYKGSNLTKTKKHERVKTREKGILIEEIQKLLEKTEIKIKMVEIDDEKIEKITKELRKTLAN